MPALIIVTGIAGSHRTCDAKCYNAKGKNCHCICLGAHHGIGFEDAAKHTRETADVILAAYRPEGTVKLYAPPLPPPHQRILFPEPEPCPTSTST